MKRYYVSDGYMEMAFRRFITIDEDDLEKEDFLDDYWMDCTEALKDMREIERKQYDTGHDVLYETKDGEKVLVYTSYLQGQGKSIAFLPDFIETIYDAREFIYQSEREFFEL